MKLTTLRVNALSIWRLLPIVVAVIGVLFWIGCSEQAAAPVAPGEGATLDPAASAIPMVKFTCTYKELGDAESFDKFVIKNNSDAGIQITAVNIYFYTASSDVIIDMSPGAPGVGQGSWLYTEDEDMCGLKEWRGLLEGGKRVVLKWWAFGPGKTFKFGLDMDRQDLANGVWFEHASGFDLASTTVVVDLKGPSTLPMTATVNLGGIDGTTASVNVAMPASMP